MRRKAICTAASPVKARLVDPTKLRIAGLAPYLAMLNLAIDRKLQGCEVVSSRMDDVAIEPGVDGVISVSGRMGVSLPAFQIRTTHQTEGGMTMPDHVYRIIQVAGSSEKSIGDAIQNAVGRASSTLRQVGWFEVVETRGHVEDGRVAHYQVTLKVGFTLDDD